MSKGFYFLLMLSFLACNSQNSSKEITADDIVLAKVNDEILLLSEIPAFQMRNIESADSITFLKNYIENWIKDETFVQKAQEGIQNFSEINSKTRRFKNDLVKATYEKKVIESLELELTEKELKDYYETHKEYFVFEENFYELEYILLPKNTSGIQQIRKNISEDKPSAFVTNYCQNNSDKCHLKSSVLKRESFVVKELNLQVNALVSSTRFKYFYPTDESVLIYKIIGKRNKGEVAPLEIVENEVSSLALENKKQEYLQDLVDKTYQKAKNDKIFENYIN